MNAAARAALSLEELLRELPVRAEIVGAQGTLVRGVRQDSRRVEPGDLFVARPGAQVDGARFVRDAASRGATAILAPRGFDAASSPLPVLLVDDIGAGLAYASAAVYGHPAFTLEVVGVTGTNGKTTVTHLVRAAVDGALGAPHCGVIGTTGHRFRDYDVGAEHTTPESDELARVMAEMLTRGATHLAMEVSSHALSLDRVRAVRFRVAAFTNLTQDHLDFHGSLAEYGEAKAKLFTELAPGAAVINVGDPFGRALVARVRAPLIRVSARSLPQEEAEIAPRSMTLGEKGIDGVLRTPGGDLHIASKLVGEHNLENMVVALGVCQALDLDLGRAAAALATEGGAPGRLERCDGEGDDITVLVDYAHTPDALGRALASVRAIARGRLLCVFGCGGDRDPTKRAPMGEAAARHVDLAILTSDNPRTESPEAIAAAVVVGLERGGLSETTFSRWGEGARGYVLDLDRRTAILGAILAASPGDVVVLAGKGHEDYQIVGMTKTPLDDRVEARRALTERRRLRAQRGQPVRGA